MAEVNDTGYPVVWGEPRVNEDGSLETVIVDPGEPFPVKAETAPTPEAPPAPEGSAAEQPVTEPTPEAPPAPEGSAAEQPVTEPSLAEKLAADQAAVAADQAALAGQPAEQTAPAEPPAV